MFWRRWTRYAVMSGTRIQRHLEEKRSMHFWIRWIKLFLWGFFFCFFLYCLCFCHIPPILLGLVSGVLFSLWDLLVLEKMRHGNTGHELEQWMSSGLELSCAQHIHWLWIKCIGWRGAINLSSPLYHYVHMLPLCGTHAALQLGGSPWHMELLCLWDWW